MTFIPAPDWTPTLQHCVKAVIGHVPGDDRHTQEELRTLLEEILLQQVPIDECVDRHPLGRRRGQMRFHRAMYLFGTLLDDLIAALQDLQRDVEIRWRLNS